MSPAAQLLALVPVAYLIGSIPFGLIVARTKGVDPRLSGSGNIGATNVARALGGKRWFFLVFFLDLFKSLGPMLLASAIFNRVPRAQHDWHVYALWLLVGFAAVLGHMYSVFLTFKGGKGVATSAGVMMGLWPFFTVPGFVAIGVFIVVLATTRYMSLGSILAACTLPVAYLAIGLARGWPVFGDQLPLLAFAVLMAGMIVWKHRTNIVRLRAGTENRMGQKRAAPSPSGNGNGANETRVPQ
jgi:acyl phosphate:glycerol-3-phosphate acyltransferase